MPKLSASLICIVLVATSVTAAEKTPGTLRGSITDRFHAPIVRAYVLVHPYEGSDVKAAVDKDANFSVSLPSGYYDVFVASPAFDPACRHVEITSGHTVTWNARLKPAASNTPD